MRDAQTTGDPGRFGLAGQVLYLIDQALRRVTGSRCRLYRYFFVVQPLDVELRLPKRLGSTMDTRLIGPEDQGNTPIFPRPPASIRERFRQDSVCLALFRQSHLAGFIWFCRDEYQEDEVRCRFRPQPADQVIWDYDLYIAPKYRNGVAFLKLWHVAVDYLRARGFRWSASRISAFSPRSLASHRRLGAITVGQAVFLKILGWQFTIATISPYVHLSTRPSQQPTFTIRPPRQKKPASSRRLK